MAAQTDPKYAIGARVINLTTDSVTGVVTGTTCEIPLSALAAAITGGVFPIPIVSGGTGAITASAALINLGVGSLGQQAANAAAITGGTIDGTPIGSVTPSTVVATDINTGTLETTGLATLATADINGGTVDGAVIGGSVPAAATVTTLSATGNDALLYRTTNAQSFATGTAATVTTWTSVFDRLGTNFAASTGIFTAPVTGEYMVCAALAWAANTGAIATVGQVLIVVNGATVATADYVRQTATSTIMTVNVAAMVHVAAGQTIVIQGLQNTGGAVLLTGTANFNFVSIHRVA